MLILTSFAPYEYVELRGMLRNACRPLPLVSFQYGWWDTLALSTMSPFKAIHLSINIQVTIKANLYLENFVRHTSLSAYEDLFLGNEESDCLPPCSLLFAKTRLLTKQVVLYIWRIESELRQRQRHKIPQSSSTGLPITSSTHWSGNRSWPKKLLARFHDAK